jgi:mRNA-degrading endonuclease YafQ of YafQ-DinJ toxin-antitoxin module
MTREARYTDEFIKKFRGLTGGHRSLVEASIRLVLSSEDPTRLAHHLERRAYYCNWSHRVRGNLIMVFRISRKSMTFLSTGTHSQAYHPKP